MLHRVRTSRTALARPPLRRSLCAQMPSSTVRSVAAFLCQWAQMASFCLLPLFRNWRPTIVPLRFTLGLVTTHGCASARSLARLARACA